MDSILTLFSSISILAFSLLCVPSIHATPYKHITVTVGTDSREALLALPAGISETGSGVEAATPSACPVVFAFHGHGGSMEYAAAKFKCEEYWPEALVVYPQGLRTAGGLIDPEGKASGWQSNAGDYGNRDLLFFDALLAYISAHYTIDRQRVYVIGHSNGGLFAYLLWAERGTDIAAIAPISAIIPTHTGKSALRPMPVFHTAGRRDPLVKFSWQLATIDTVLKVDGCSAPPEIKDSTISIYKSAFGADVAAYIHDGGHEIPHGAVKSIIAFFKSVHGGR